MTKPKASTPATPRETHSAINSNERQLAVTASARIDALDSLQARKDSTPEQIEQWRATTTDLLKLTNPTLGQVFEAAPIDDIPCLRATLRKMVLPYAPHLLNEAPHVSGPSEADLAAALAKMTPEALEAARRSVEKRKE